MAKFIVLEGTLDFGNARFGPGEIFDAEVEEVAGSAVMGRIKEIDLTSKDVQDQLIASSRYAELPREELFQLLADRGSVPSNSCSTKTLVKMLEKMDAEG